MTKTGKFALHHGDQEMGVIEWSQLGAHNAQNATAALLAAQHAGVPIDVGLQALKTFRGVSRRLEKIGCPKGIHIYDDFAHHPTAIAATLGALRASQNDARIVALLEPRSNTMRMGYHADALSDALSQADRALIYLPPGVEWRPQLDDSIATMHTGVEDMISVCCEELRPGDHVVIMSNGGF